MMVRHVKKFTALGHNVQFGFQIRATGPGRDPSRLRWKIADLVNDHAPREQCWSDLVSWVFRSGRGERPLLDLLPWRPVDRVCREDAARTGACYCGKVATAACVAAGGPAATVIFEPAPVVTHG